MKRIIAVLLSVLLLLSLASCGGGKGGVNVTVSKVKTDSTLDGASYNACLQAATEVTMVPKVMATINEVRFAVGDSVKQGDVLIVLDQTDVLNQMNQAQAAYGVAKINYENAKGGSASSTRLKLQQAVDSARIGVDSATVAFNSAQSNYDKISYLVSIGEESNFNLQQAENSLNTARNALENAKNALKAAQDTYQLSDSTLIPESIAVASKQLDSAKASVSTAQSALNNTKLTAPISGVIAEIQATKGEMASAQSTKVTIIDPSSMDLVVSVTGSDMLSLQSGMQVPILVTDLPNPYTGTVLSISPSADATSGLFDVKIKLENPDGSLRAGMLATAQFSNPSDSSKLYVPQQSVVEENGTYYVYKITDNKTEKVTVTLGATKNLYVEIQSGLTMEDIVVVDGIDKVTENASVNIIKSIE